MHKLDQKGELLVPLVIATVLPFSSIGFGAWAFMSRQDYKNNSDLKSVEAVTAAEEALILKKDAEFAEAQKLPFTTYRGPASYGTLGIQYPKTWSVYIDEGGSTAPLSGTMHPAFVPSNEDVNFALRFEVLNSSYERELKDFDSAVKQAKATVSAYRLPKVDSALGARVEGQLTSKKQGVMVILPLRDKTIRIWTEGQDFRGDFEAILKELTFIP